MDIGQIINILKGIFHVSPSGKVFLNYGLNDLKRILGIIPDTAKMILIAVLLLYGIVLCFFGYKRTYRSKSLIKKVFLFVVLCFIVFYACSSIFDEPIIAMISSAAIIVGFLLLIKPILMIFTSVFGAVIVSIILKFVLDIRESACVLTALVLSIIGILFQYYSNKSHKNKENDIPVDSKIISKKKKRRIPKNATSIQGDNRKRRRKRPSPNNNGNDELRQRRERQEDIRRRRDVAFAKQNDENQNTNHQNRDSSFNNENKNIKEDINTPFYDEDKFVVKREKLSIYDETVTITHDDEDDYDLDNEDYNYNNESNGSYEEDNRDLNKDAIINNDNKDLNQTTIINNDNNKDLDQTTMINNDDIDDFDYSSYRDKDEAEENYNNEIEDDYYEYYDDEDEYEEDYIDSEAEEDAFDTFESKMKKLKRVVTPMLSKAKRKASNLKKSHSQKRKKPKKYHGDTEEIPVIREDDY